MAAFYLSHPLNLCSFGDNCKKGRFLNPTKTMGICLATMGMKMTMHFEAFLRRSGGAES